MKKSRMAIFVTNCLRYSCIDRDRMQIKEEIYQPFDKIIQDENCSRRKAREKRRKQSPSREERQQELPIMERRPLFGRLDAQTSLETKRSNNIYEASSGKSKLAKRCRYLRPISCETS